MVDIVAPDKLHDFTMYKYVRLNDGEFRFLPIPWQHNDLVEMEERPNVVSAGTIWIKPDGFYITDTGSRTLKINGMKCDEDGVLLAELIGKPELTEY